MVSSTVRIIINYVTIGEYILAKIKLMWRALARVKEMCGRYIRFWIKADII